MRPPLQALLIAGEEAHMAVLDGTKKITIREGHRDYVAGKPVILCCHVLNWASMRQVTSVRHTTLKEVTWEEMCADGFGNYDHMEREMRRFYHDIGPDSPVTVVAWE